MHVVSAVVAEWRTEFTIRQRSAPQTSMEQRDVAEDGRSPRERSFSTNPCSPANRSPNEVGLIPLSWSCRFVAGSGPADLAGGGSAFVPQIALLIVAARENRRVLAGGRNLEVIPVTRGVSSWKVSRQRLSRRVVVSCRSRGSRGGKDIVGS